MTRDSDETAARPLRRAPAILGLALLAFSTTACESEVGGEFVFTNPDIAADLEVLWSIDGSDSPELCFELGIAEWYVTVNGPEVGDLSLGCEDLWTTGSAFYGLLEGTYEVIVSAHDVLGYEITSQATAVDVFDDGFGTQVVDLQFFSSDFF